MLKVMIVDDEIYVVALIKKLIDWEKFGMQVVADANDGYTALQMVREIEPDIVIVDVRMPGHDGISFMDEVRKFNANVRFVVISGHKQFDYAKGAMRNNAEDYLLKPINKEELERVLANISEKLQNAQENQERIKALECELDTSKLKVRSSLIEAILQKDLRDVSDSLSDTNDRYMASFSPGCFRLICFVTDVPSTSSNESGDNSFLIETMRQSIRKALQEQCTDVLETNHWNRQILLLNYDSSIRQNIPSILQAHIKNFENQVKKFRDCSVCVALGKEVTDLTKICDTVPDLEKCVFSRTVFPTGRIIEPENLCESDSLFSAIWNLKKDSFSQALERLDIQAAYLCIKDIYSKAYYSSEEDVLIYYKLYETLLRHTWTYFSDIGLCTEKWEPFFEKYKEKYLNAPIYGEYPRILHHCIQEYISENDSLGKDLSAPAIRIIKKYIASHYQEDLSLSMVAEVVHITPVYLSRLFKKEEGINFLDYLNQYRIDAAKKLLLDLNYNVIEIASMTGFQNTKYFSKVFKKNVGITPSEYRKRQLGRDQ